MRRIALVAAVSLSAIVASSSVAFAQARCVIDGSGTLSNVAGNVTVTTGSGSSPAVDGAAVSIGDIIRVGPDGAVTIIGANGCEVVVDAGSRVRIGPRGQINVASLGSGPNLGGLPAPAIAAGVLGVSIAGAGIARNRNDDDPVSP